jgi:hypothetical protein
VCGRYSAISDLIITLSPRSTSLITDHRAPQYPSRPEYCGHCAKRCSRTSRSSDLRTTRHNPQSSLLGDHTNQPLYTRDPQTVPAVRVCGPWFPSLPGIEAASFRDPPAEGHCTTKVSTNGWRSLPESESEWTRANDSTYITRVWLIPSNWSR